MQQRIKRLMQRLIPEPIFANIQSRRSRNYQRKFLERTGLINHTRTMIDRFGLKVLHGPFKGMIYPELSIMSRHGIPRLLGSYEMELHSWIDGIIKNQDAYEAFIDIGCAEGYYAVGMAFVTSIPVIAFDNEPREVVFAKEMAHQNAALERIQFRDWCDTGFLASLAGKRCFVLSDCEGFEYSLFNKDAMKGLELSDLLIELHFLNDGRFSALIDRFSGTHFIESVCSTDRDPFDFPELSFFGDLSKNVINEYRGEVQRWILLRSKKYAANQ